MKNKNQYANTIRWVARITGTFFALFTSLMGIGYLFEGYQKPAATPSSSFDTRLIITFIFWGLGLAALVIALWKEWWGGLISMLCFIIFLGLVATSPNPESHFSSILFIFLIPSVLYLYYCWLTRSTLSNKTNTR